VELDPSLAVVMNGIKVVDKKAPKLRKCMDMNGFLNYEAFMYERWSVVADLFVRGDWMYSTVDTSGYWHVPLHPSASISMAKCCVEVEGIDWYSPSNVASPKQSICAYW
jgi:hypothetical protein